MDRRLRPDLCVGSFGSIVLHSSQPRLHSVYPLVVTFAQTGLVSRLATAVLATGLVVVGLLSTAARLTLDSIAKGLLEAKRPAYLNL